MKELIVLSFHVLELVLTMVLVTFFSGTCICSSGWTGVTCALVKCPNDCSGQGRCAGGQCFCTGRWKGSSCNVEEPDYVQIAIIAVILFIVGIILIAGGFLIWRQITISQLTQKN
jgi:hypothetical protein